MSNKKVLTGKERKAQLLEAGAKLAAKHGTANVTRRMVAKACGCAEGLVNVYMGDAETAQKAYARKAKALGLELPTKAESDAKGAKLRAHGPRDKRDTRKRSAKEVEAIKRKAVPAKKSAAGKATTARSATPVRSAASQRETKPTVPRERKPVQSPALPLPSPAPAPQQAPERKSAARKPIAPPKLPMPPSS